MAFYENDVDVLISEEKLKERIRALGQSITEAAINRCHSLPPCCD